MPHWSDPRIEYLPEEEVAPLRLEALRGQVRYARERSPFYGRRLRGVEVEGLRSLEDLAEVPATTRADLAESYREMACRPPAEWADVSRTSGTSGRPIYIPATLGDLERIRGFVGRQVEGFGIRPEDSVALLLPLDELINPPVILEHVFRQRLGCLTLRIGSPARERQLGYLLDLRPSVVVGAPTPFLLLGRLAAEQGHDPRGLGIRTAILMGQPLYGAGWTHNATARAISELWGCQLFSIYGTTEWYSGLGECEAHAGHHVQWESLVTEVVDPVTGRPVKPGEPGELVLTTLYREALPLVRYRTGDLTRMLVEPCACGRTSPRIMEVLGRTDDLLKVRGATIFPVQLEEAVGSVEGVRAYAIAIEADAEGSDRLVVRVAAEGDPEEVAGRVRQAVKSATRVAPEVSQASLEAIEASWYEEGGRKPRKLRDLRG